MNTLPNRRLTAIFAADVVGYSKLMAEDEAGTLSLLKKHRHTVFNPEISKHGGRIFKLMGDGTLVEFPSVVDAVAAALSIQESLAKQRGAIQLRIGINLGDVIFDGDDIFGDGVNIAARLEELAEPGGLCISSVVHESLGNRIDTKFVNAGEYEVKNIPHLIRIYRYKPDVVEPVSHSDKTPESSERPSIAVLPFDNMSSDPEQEFLADGITEDLITALSKVRWFFVIARNSTFTYKGQAVDVKQVARDLGVRYVLEGSTRRAGERVRITAQLIEAGTGRHVWAERYDRQIKDIFDLQDEMTQTIVGAVEPELSAAERKRALNKAPENLDAWECYQRGLWHLWKYQKDNHRQGLELLQRATELDPGFASAYAWEGYAHYNAVIMGWSPNAQQS
jgi:adenylate cyclase